MRRGISFTVSAGDGQRLRAIVADPKSPQKHVWRARIVLLSGAGLGTSAIMGETDKSKTCVWRWQERFMHEGVGGLLRDKSRPPGKAPIAPDRVAWIVRQTQQPPPHEATHWTLRAMAKAAGVAQEGQGQRLARPSSTLDFPLHANLVFVAHFPLHANLVFVAQCRRGLLCQTHAAQAQARYLPFPRRSPGRHQSLRP